MKIIIYFLTMLMSFGGLVICGYTALLGFRDIAVGADETAHFTIAIVCLIGGLISGIVADRLEENL